MANTNSSAPTVKRNKEDKQSNGANRVKKTVHISAPVSEVWRALTDPSIVKKYFFGTTLRSDFKQGGAIQYSGVWEGKAYEDKGIIQRLEKDRILEHTYWSSMSGIPDTPENYATVRYELKTVDDGTDISITQETKKGAAADKAYSNSGDNWEKVLNSMKELLENEYQPQH